jgi:hypothetical protein
VSFHTRSLWPPRCALCWKRAFWRSWSALGVLKVMKSAKAVNTFPKLRLLRPLKSTLSWQSGLWLRCLRMGLRNLCRMTECPRFNQKQILEARRRSLKLDLLPHQGRGLPPKLLFRLCLLLAPLGLRHVAFGFGKC